MRFLIFVLANFLIFSCSLHENETRIQSSSSENVVSSSSMPDDFFRDGRDGRLYRYVTIGSQTWMAENLDYKTESGSVCYNNQESNCSIYGRMYNWVTAMMLDTDCSKNNCSAQILLKHRGNCPEGWYVPSVDEWKTLTNFVGESTAGIKLRAKDVWKTNSVTSEFPLIPGTDEYGFSALPGGLGSCGLSDGCSPEQFSFGQIGGLGEWLTATAGIGTSFANTLSMSGGGSDVFYYESNKKFLSYVRCIKGDEKYWTIAFNTNGGTPATILTALVDDGFAFGSKYPANPVKEGYTFGGWFNGEEQYTTSTIIIKNATLVAKWNKLNNSEDGGTLKDSRDEKSYSTVIIGGKRWMAQNLNYETNNSWCYGNVSSNCEEYGRLYSWDAAMEACPEQWHLPTNDDWGDLIQNAGGYELAGGVLKSKNGWSGNDTWECLYLKTCRDGNDDFGFSALPGGYKDYNYKDENRSFGKIEVSGYWWSADETDFIVTPLLPDLTSERAYTFIMRNNSESVIQNNQNKNNGLSIRCVLN